MDEPTVTRISTMPNTALPQTRSSPVELIPFF
jgi:hypothetical protein